MPKWAKILIALGCGSGLVIIAIGVGGYIYINNHKDAWIAEGRKTNEEGRTFAAGKSGNDCVDETLSRLKNCSGIPCEIRVRIFLDGCLEAAAESPQLCEGVPPKSEIIRTVQWTLDQCARHGMPNSQPCSRVMQEVQKHCAKKSL